MKLKLNTKAYLNKELYVGIFAILFSIILMNLKDNNSDLYVIYPKTIYKAMLAIGIVMVVTTFFSDPNKDYGKVGIALSEIVVLGLLLISRPLIGFLGLYSSIFIISTSLSIFINPDKSKKNIIKLLVFNIILIVFLFIAFDVFLKVNAPNALFI